MWKSQWLRVFTILALVLNSAPAMAQNSDGRPLLETFGPEMKITTFNIGPDFWRFFGDINETELDTRPTIDWHPFVEGDVWVIYVSNVDEYIQLPDLIVQVLASKDPDSSSAITHFMIDLDDGRKIAMQVIRVDRLMETGNTLQVIDCKAARSLFGAIHGRTEQQSFERFRDCKALHLG